MQDVEIFEVGPRDGLQNEPRFIPTAEKVALIDCLSRAGFRRIEVASFVSPKWVPQMADGAEVLGGISKGQGISYGGLTPNMRGLDAAIAAGVSEVAVFASASEGFSRANLNCSIDESFDRFAPICAKAQELGLPVRGYVSCVTDCPYDGSVPPEAVARVAERLFGLGCYEISLGDTIGQGQPDRVGRMIDRVVEVLPVSRLAGHYHDTAGRAIENVAVSLEKGVRVFDASIAGLGGCPYAPGAAGNIATETLNDWLTGQGYQTGLDPKVLAEAAALARAMIGGGDA